MLAVLIAVIALAIPAQLPLPDPPTQVCVPTPITPCDPTDPIPLPPPPEPGCIPLPVPITPCPPTNPPEPPPTDDPPVFPGKLVIEAHTTTYIQVKWKPAKDDKKVIRYVFLRDKKYLGWKPNTAIRFRFKLACGKHKYGVIALDAYLQQDRLTVTVNRKCKSSG